MAVMADIFHLLVSRHNDAACVRRADDHMESTLSSLCAEIEAFGFDVLLITDLHAQLRAIAAKNLQLR